VGRLVITAPSDLRITPDITAPGYHIYDSSSDNSSEVVTTTLATSPDVNQREQWFDILKWVGPFECMGEIWIGPKVGEYVNRCTWLRKLPKQNKYIYRIHGTKPEYCRIFPKSKRHAIDDDCKGFPAE
jgi:hypothetical protein